MMMMMMMMIVLGTTQYERFAA